MVMKAIVAVLLMLVCVLMSSCIFSNEENKPKVDQTFDVWGIITDSYGDGLPEVSITITISASGEHTSMTDQDGMYSFEEIKSGTCTIIPQKSGYVFDPSQAVINLDGSQSAGIDFNAYPDGLVAFGNLSDQTGLNEQITVERISDVNSRIISSFLNIIRLLEDTPSEMSQSNVRHVNGLHSGYAAVEHDTSDEWPVKSYVYSSDLYDYSDDGELYIGGRLIYTSHENMNSTYRTITIKGSVVVGGAYKGTVSFYIEKSYNGPENFTGFYHLISDAETTGGEISSDDFNIWENSAEHEETYSISGIIRDNSSNVIPDVMVMLGDGTVTTVTDSEGTYWFGNLPDGSYMITPVFTGYTFNPSSTRAVLDGEAIRADITGIATGDGHNITGRVLDNNGTGLAGVYMSLVHDDYRFVTYSDDDGNYVFLNVPDAAYTLLPISDIYDFNPVYQSVVLIDGDVSVNDTIGTSSSTSGTGYTIYGIIFDSAGNGIPDVSISLSGLNRMAVSDENGNYYFENVPNGVYVLTPELAGYFFLPGSGRISIENDNMNVNFLGSKVSG